MRGDTAPEKTSSRSTPGGHQVADLASMEETEVEDAFVAPTENDARFPGTRSTADEDRLPTWEVAEEQDEKDAR